MRRLTRGFVLIQLIALIVLGVLASGGAGLYVYKSQVARVEAEEAKHAADQEKIAQLEEHLRILESQKNGTNTESVALTEIQKQLDELRSQKKTALPVALPAAKTLIQPTVGDKPTITAKTSDTLTSVEIAEKARLSVVSIESRGSKGTGFIIGADGLILTNAHVVGAAIGATLTFADKKTSFGYVTGQNDEEDVAIIRTSGLSYTPIEFADSSDEYLKQGSPLYTFGYPFGFDGEVSFKDGTLSRRLNYNTREYLEMSNLIHPGNSGGPVLNSAGKVIGMSTFMLGNVVDGVTLGESIKLAIPGSRLKIIYEKLLTQEHAYSSAQKAEIQVFENYLTKYYNISYIIAGGLDSYSGAFTNYDQVKLTESLSTLDTASRELTTLTSQYPKNLPFSHLILNQLQKLRRVTTDIIATEELSREMISIKVINSQSAYSSFDDLIKRVEATMEIYKVAQNDQGEIERSANAYFGW